MTNPAITPCPSCDAVLLGDYCAACGQRAPRAADFTLKSFARELWTEVSGSDSRLWRTVLGLFRPGVLTLAYLQYRWRAYLPPLRLYLVMSALFFLLAWDAYFQAQLLQARSAPPEAMPEAVRGMFNDPAISERISDWTAFYRFAGVLFLGLLVKLLHWRLPIGRHLVFAAHYYCADYVIYLLASPLLYYASAQAYPSALGGVTGVGMLWLLWWAVLADRRVYGGGWAGNVFRGLLILCADVMISMIGGQLAIASVFLSRA
ncbi:DUF3667 domain-containing protein [Arenimonas sp.]|uniref:DUF3667 domain-containing protein n=1 Tax=Arenimonas sp. TaxID=1872635 RepID=UPI0039E6F6AC